MRRVFFRWAPAGVLAVLASALCQAEDRGVPASHGIANFGRINDRLYRGAQPDAAGLASLKKLGVTTILCLRMPNELWAPEKAEAASNGMTFINIPLKGVGRPREGEVRQALSLMDKSPGPVFVHCEHGCDRTGTIIACYRIEHDHWTGAAAQKEAGRYGMSWLEHGMKSFIAEFAGAASKTKRGTPHQQSAKFRLAPAGALAKLTPCARRFIPAVSIPSPTGTWIWWNGRPNFLTASSWRWR
jgi:protein tyrosine phosphatase (PTP) superfamily phosphohydrolase (DUF442 family)